jgi:hypothetical protein
MLQAAMGRRAEALVSYQDALAIDRETGNWHQVGVARRVADPFELGVMLAERAAFDARNGRVAVARRSRRWRESES